MIVLFQNDDCTITVSFTMGKPLRKAIFGVKTLPRLIKACVDCSCIRWCKYQQPINYCVHYFCQGAYSRSYHHSGLTCCYPSNIWHHWHNCQLHLSTLKFCYRLRICKSVNYQHKKMFKTNIVQTFDERLNNKIERIGLKTEPEEFHILEQLILNNH